MKYNDSTATQHKPGTVLSNSRGSHVVVRTGLERMAEMQREVHQHINKSPITRKHEALVVNPKKIRRMLRKQAKANGAD